ncbi:hypothetical protein [Parasulfitobacter algicola]|uniref:Lipoprotein n=1 Tax=Parasulfitobacter algicola TaxID=2614809 RepID=A0ABX2IPK7_9RHOB|nr:hypothetical protein [Sulfitobacter algicola]NSX54798.1 hypothetical protein [Sulfitobacter algicola]
MTKNQSNSVKKIRPPSKSAFVALSICMLSLSACGPVSRATTGIPVTTQEQQDSIDYIQKLFVDACVSNFQNLTRSAEVFKANGLPYVQVQPAVGDGKDVIYADQRTSRYASFAKFRGGPLIDPKYKNLQLYSCRVGSAQISLSDANQIRKNVSEQLTRVMYKGKPLVTKNGGDYSSDFITIVAASANSYLNDKNVRAAEISLIVSPALLENTDLIK